MADTTSTASTSSLSTSGLISGSIKWSGLSSGVDFSTVVDQLVKIEHLNADRLTTWKSDWTEKLTSISGLNSRMVSLRDNATDMSEFNKFYTRQTTSSDQTVLTATNTSSAVPGTHTITVGENIPGQVISKSYQTGLAVGGTGDLGITVGSSTLTIQQGAGNGDGTWNPNLDLDQLALDIKAADNAQPTDQQILGDVYTITDKTRSGDTYKRLIITAKVPTSGTTQPISVSDPTNLSMDQNSIDPVYYKTWMFSTATVTAGGDYQGSTNKTFTFAAESTGTIGTDDIKFSWADNEGNSGSFIVKAADWQLNNDIEYSVLQGVTVKFGAGNIALAESFTIDAHNPTLQQAQEKGLAQAEQRVHQGFIDLITPVHSSPSDTAATFVYKYEGVETSVSVPSGTTLEGLVQAINNDSNNRGVKATIINDGQGTSTSYHLVLTGRQTGAEHTIRIVSSDMSNFAVTDADFDTAQKASNAMIKLDGYPSSSYKHIQRSSNSISDVVDGLAINLHDVGTATVTISDNKDAVKSKIQQLVQSVNFVQDYVRQETKYDKDTGEKGVMIGNYTYDIVLNSINDILNSRVPGLQDGTDTYLHLAQIGITTDPDQSGMWVVDTTKLDDALNNNIEAVARLFVNDPSHGDGGSKGVAEQLSDKLQALTDPQNGIANVLTKNYNDIISDIDTKIASEEKRIALYKTNLEEKFARLETTLSELNGQSQYLTTQLEKLNSS